VRWQQSRLAAFENQAWHELDTMEAYGDGEAQQIASEGFSDNINALS
jgi:hypothetical protein